MKENDIESRASNLIERSIQEVNRGEEKRQMTLLPGSRENLALECFFFQSLLNTNISSRSVVRRLKKEAEKTAKNKNLYDENWFYKAVIEVLIRDITSETTIQDGWGAQTTFRKQIPCFAPELVEHYEHLHGKDPITLHAATSKDEVAALVSAEYDDITVDQSCEAPGIDVQIWVRNCAIQTAKALRETYACKSGDMKSVARMFSRTFNIFSLNAHKLHNALYMKDGQRNIGMETRAVFDVPHAQWWSLLTEWLDDTDVEERQEFYEAVKHELASDAEGYAALRLDRFDFVDQSDITALKERSVVAVDSFDRLSHECEELRSYIQDVDRGTVATRNDVDEALRASNTGFVIIDATKGEDTPYEAAVRTTHFFSINHCMVDASPDKDPDTFVRYRLFDGGVMTSSAQRYAPLYHGFKRTLKDERKITDAIGGKVMDALRQLDSVFVDTPEVLPKLKEKDIVIIETPEQTLCTARRSVWAHIEKLLTSKKRLTASEIEALHERFRIETPSKEPAAGCVLAEHGNEKEVATTEIATADKYPNLRKQFNKRGWPNAGAILSILRKCNVQHIGTTGDHHQYARFSEGEQGEVIGNTTIVDRYRETNGMWEFFYLTSTLDSLNISEAEFLEHYK